MLDEWSGLADLLANLIEKYALDLDIGDMPDTAINTESKVEKRERIGILYCKQHSHEI